MMLQGTKFVEKMMESLIVKDLKDKDLFPNKNRYYLLYLGEEGFEAHFR